MSNKFISVEKEELNNFVKKVKNTEEFKMIISELVYKNKIASEKFEVVEASRLENSEFKIAMLILVQDNIKVVFIDYGTEYKFTLRIIEKNDGIEMAYLYEILDKDLVLTNKNKYEDILYKMQELDKSPIPQNFNREEVNANLFCLHGNWGGAKCSGPAGPIDPVDSCCQAHDKCYAKQGYFSCACNRTLKKCLKPYLAEGSQWAILVTAAFVVSPCKEIVF